MVTKGQRQTEWFFLSSHAVLILILFLHWEYVVQFEPERKEKLSKGDFIIGLMDNDFKDVLPEGLASYSDHIDDDEHYQNDFKVISSYVYFRLRFGLIII